MRIIYVNSRVQLLLDSDISGYRWKIYEEWQELYKPGHFLIFACFWSFFFRCSSCIARISKIPPKPFRRDSRYSCLKHILYDQIFLTFSEKKKKSYLKLGSCDIAKSLYKTEFLVPLLTPYCVLGRHIFKLYRSIRNNFSLVLVYFITFSQ